MLYRSFVLTEDEDALDQEWVSLIKQAKSLGLSTEDVRTILSDLCEGY